METAENKAPDFLSESETWQQQRLRIIKAAGLDPSIMDAEITPELRKEWFIDYGTMNLWDEETQAKYFIADALHERDKKEHPELHQVLPQKAHCNCWEENNCSCGFCWACDSSD